MDNTKKWRSIMFVVIFLSHLFVITLGITAVFGPTSTIQIQFVTVVVMSMYIAIYGSILYIIFTMEEYEEETA